MKYKLTKKTKTLPNGTVLYQIQALIDIPNVCKKGDLGGWIESEKNLSQENMCWVSDSAQVSGNAQVYDNARVYCDARVYEYAQISGYAQVYGYAHVSGNAYVYNYAHVYDHAHVSGNARVYVLIKFDCDFDPWELFIRMINNKEKLPLLMGYDDPDLNKIIEQKLKKS